MRKLELVYLHELFSLVRDEYEQQLGHTIDCDAYDQLRTHPQAIAQQKATHREAIRALGCDLTAVIAERPAPDTEPAAEAPASHQKT